MKIKRYNNTNLWLAISVLLFLMVTCKSKVQQQNNQQTIEQPKPASESQTDSLKNVLDKKRADKLKK